uniref:Uncharacterized protein n=1 Tax=Trypanosoma congolense (strain IL3000) TaxID=1068625 RepID=G0USH9_TRYCI|nr:conserved hypothetical protein [Trypanosoma congolense IL3000]
MSCGHPVPVTTVKVNFSFFFFLFFFAAFVLRSTLEGLMGNQEELNRKAYPYGQGGGNVHHPGSRRTNTHGHNKSSRTNTISNTHRGVRSGFKPLGGRANTIQNRSSAAQDGTIPAAYISPFQASRPQSGQHSASVVRTSVSGPSQQQLLFYSSVQRRGGVFTKTAHETTVQLARTGVLPNSVAFRKRARSAMECGGEKAQSLEERFSSMREKKTEAELRQAKELVKRQKSNRFDASSGEDED